MRVCGVCYLILATPDQCLLNPPNPSSSPIGNHLAYKLSGFQFGVLAGDFTCLTDSSTSVTIELMADLTIPVGFCLCVKIANDGGDLTRCVEPSISSG